MGQPAPQSFLAATKRDVRIRIVVIGANPILGSPPYAPLLQAGNTELVGFEPNGEALAKLQSLKGPNETYLPHAIGDGTRHTLHFCQEPGMTSLLRPDPAVLDLFHGFPDWGRVLATEDVDTVRLDDIAETAGTDFIKIDIQGAELMALSNAPNRLADAVVIQTEVEFLPMYKGQPLFSEVESFLRGHGFMLHRFFPLVSRVVRPLLMNNDIRAGLSQILWADAIFIRDITRLSALSDLQLLKTARILHECYQSADLVLHLLLELDRRTESGLGNAYKSFLMSLS